MSFSDSLVVCQRRSGNLSNSHSLRKVSRFNSWSNLFIFFVHHLQPVTCLASVSTSSGTTSLIATAHPGQLQALVLAGNEWDRVSLMTNHLEWPTDYECQYLSVSESTCGSVIVAVGYAGVVGVWKLSSSDCWTSEVVGSFNIPLLCSLTLAQDSLVATTLSHNLLVRYDHTYKFFCFGMS